MDAGSKRDIPNFLDAKVGVHSSDSRVSACWLVLITTSEHSDVPSRCDMDELWPIAHGFSKMLIQNLQ